MIEKKQKSLERVISNISELKINKFCKLLEENKIELSTDFYKIKKNVGINSNEEKYFLELLSNFKNYEDLILLIKLFISNKQIQRDGMSKTNLVWSSPIKYHEKIDQTYSVFLKMVNDSKKSIIFVGYAMTDDENLELFEALKKAAKERHVMIKIIFDKATKAKKWGKWTKSPKKIISKLWGDIEYFPQIYTYDDVTSSLHAKFLIIDEEEILVTSANMTDRAMTRNLEMGIRHRGKIAKDAVDMIDLLITKKILSEINYG